MKNNAYRCAKIKHQLDEKKRRGIKFVDWKLSREQLEFVESHYKTEVYLYEVTTRRFMRIQDLDPILKHIHYKNKKGSKTMVLRLTRNQIKILDQFDVKYRPCKYRIFLTD